MPAAWLPLLGLPLASQAPPVTPAVAPSWTGAFDAPPVVAWQTRLPSPPLSSATHAELGAPLLHDDVLYVGSAGEDALLVLDRRSGRLLERLEAAAPVQSAPRVEDDTLLYTDTSGTVWAWRVPDHVLLWSHHTSAPSLATPAVDDGRIYISTVSNVVIALERQTGELAWRVAAKLDPARSAELQLFGAPPPVRMGDVVLAGFSDGTLSAIDARSGEVRWKQQIGEGQYPDLLAAPVVVGDDIIAGGYTEPLVCLDSKTHAIRWRLDVGTFQTPLLWGGFGDTPAPTAEGPHAFLFHAGTDGVLRCVDARTGDELWSWDSETGTALTTPVATQAGILVSASGGGLSLLDTTSGALLWEWQVPIYLSGITTPPAVDGRQAVVLTNAANLVGFMVPEPEPEWVRTTDLFSRVPER